jgi:hypothetical protein
MRPLALIAVALLAMGAMAQEAPVPEQTPALEPVPVDPSGAEGRPAEQTPGVEPVSLTPAEVGTPPAEPPPIGTPEPEASAPFAHRVEGTGYLSLRGGFSRSRVAGLIPTNDLPEVTGLVELNGQVKVNYLARSFIYGDVSLIAQAGSIFRGVDSDGKEIGIDDHDVAATRPAVSLNELYVLHEFRPELNVLLGKKRVVWGSGQAYNPTDLLNIRKDPTDPTFQRAGAWMARVEVPLETLAFTAVFAPGLLKQQSGIPQQFLTWPDWDRKDDQAHYLVALRAYALVADADVNLMLFYSNLFNDSFEKKVRFGGSFSRYFFTDYELHTEILIGSGSSRDYVNHDCVASGLIALGCAQANTPFVTKSQLTDLTLMPKLLVGSRRQFDDESFVSVEYLYQAEGYTREQFQDQVNGLDLVQQAKALGVPANRIPNLNGTTATDGVPQRFTFDPQVQHYLFVTYNKPRIRDDFTAQLVMIANLQDLSTLWSPSVSWSVTEWMTVSAIGFIPVPGLDSLAAKRLNGTPVTEYGNFPVAYRAVLEARIFY